MSKAVVRMLVLAGVATAALACAACTKVVDARGFNADQYEVKESDGDRGLLGAFGDKPKRGR
jgi:recombinational DNA repair protein (RecF pathway)